MNNNNYGGSSGSNNSNGNNNNNNNNSNSNSSSGSRSRSSSGTECKEVEIIGILSSSQGKIAVISALLAGIGYTVLTSITSDDLHVTPTLAIPFLITSTMVVAGNIFVAIICSMSEQEGEVAQAMSILRESRQFNQQLEKWWQKFSPLRTQSVWIFYFSVPLLFVSIALLSLIKWVQPYSSIVALLFLLFGAYTTHQIFWLSSIFRSDVLLIETFQEVKYNTKLKRVLSSRDSSRYNLLNDGTTPPPTPAPAPIIIQSKDNLLASSGVTKSPREKFQSKTQSSFHFHDVDMDDESPTPRYSYEHTPSFSIKQSDQQEKSLSTNPELTSKVNGNISPPESIAMPAPQGQYHVLREIEETDEDDSHLQEPNNLSKLDEFITITQRKKVKKNQKKKKQH